METARTQASQTPPTPQTTQTTTALQTAQNTLQQATSIVRDVAQTARRTYTYDRSQLGTAIGMLRQVYQQLPEDAHTGATVPDSGLPPLSLIHI